MKMTALIRHTQTAYQMKHSVPYINEYLGDFTAETLNGVARELNGILGHGKIKTDERGVKCVEHHTASWHARYYMPGTEPKGKDAKIKF